MSLLDVIKEYDMQITRTHLNLQILLNCIEYIRCRVETQYILLPTIIDYIINQQIDNMKPLNIVGIKSETEQIMAVMDFAAIKLLSTKKTMECLIPFIKKWEMSTKNSEKFKEEIELGFAELFRAME
jgi:hypothetical protein